MAASARFGQQRGDGDTDLAELMRNVLRQHRTASAALSPGLCLLYGRGFECYEEELYGL